MQVKFVVYEKESTRVICTLDSEPDNANWYEQAKIIHNGSMHLNGIKWDAVGTHTFPKVVEVDVIPFESTFDTKTSTIHQPTKGE